MAAVSPLLLLLSPPHSDVSGVDPIDQDEFVFWRYRKSPEGEVAVGPRLDLGQAREPLGSDADETSGATQSAACLSITGSESCRVPIAQPWSRQSARLRAGD
ncbi:hypothetical protein BZA05DRAFT_415631 [Tricharina praecox]|uniref:uncharacterized protein n=1 Tax=Tricharina praecox TaxID=43433 RepID=UPI0022209C14|nr:uncharacterized protein BZA05DRAFT_415631 [Tricharina praecox]KAI5856909.1 hypothetical protein BZA05DRAFT_415631 [Tricharina praecox]